MVFRLSHLVISDYLVPSLVRRPIHGPLPCYLFLEFHLALH